MKKAFIDILKWLAFIPISILLTNVLYFETVLLVIKGLSGNEMQKTIFEWAGWFISVLTLYIVFLVFRLMFRFLSSDTGKANLIILNVCSLFFFIKNCIDITSSDTIGFRSTAVLNIVVIIVFIGILVTSFMANEHSQKST